MCVGGALVDLHEPAWKRWTFILRSAVCWSQSGRDGDVVMVNREPPWASHEKLDYLWSVGVWCIG